MANTKPRPKSKTDVPVSAPKKPLGQRVSQGYLKALAKMKPKPVQKKNPKGAAARKRDWSKGRGSVYTEVPPITDVNIQEIGFYGVVEPFSYLRATYDNATSEYVLSAIEPKLTEDEEEILKLIKDTLEKTLDYDWDKLTVMDKKTFLEKSVDSFIKSRGLSIELSRCT